MMMISIEKENLVIKTEQVDGYLYFIAYMGDHRIGTLKTLVADSKLYAYVIHVSKEYRRQGVATALYSYAENHFGLKISPYEFCNPDAETSDDAIEFWRKRGIILTSKNRIDDC